MSKEIYFKRVKRPVNNIEEAKSLKTETKIYLIISIVVTIVLALFAEQVPKLTIMIQLISYISFFFAMYFGIMLFAIGKAMGAMDNLACTRCKAKLGASSCTGWTELDRRWQAHHSDNYLSGKLYVTVRFECTCPNCGESKTFTETLCSGRINITEHCSVADIMPAQQLVDDYFNNSIHT